MKKRIIALLLCAVMIAVLLPFGAFADEPTVVKSGSIGDRITWTLDSEGVLRIDGTGAIPDYGDPHHGGPKSPFYQLNLNNNVHTLIVGEGITSIGNYAFGEMRFSGAVLPSTVERIGDYAFYYCQSLRSVQLPEGLKSIGVCAFCKCSGLLFIRLPDSLSAIEESAFLDATKLMGVDLGKGLETIGPSAFQSCKLQYVAIPDSVKTIADYAFSSNNGLTEITLGTGITSIKAHSFPNTVKAVYTELSKADATAKYSACTNLKNASWNYSHIHSYTEAFTEPLCVNPGYTTFTCVHGDSYKSYYVPGAYDHVPELYPGYPATYDATGLTDGSKCAVCGKILESRHTIPKLVDKIYSVNVKGLDAPEIGKKLDYSFELVPGGEGRFITEGELAPEICWYVFNDAIADWEYIESKDYVCKDARAYAFEIYADVDEHSQLTTDGSYPSTIPVSINASRDESAVGKVTEGTSLCIYKAYPMRSYDKAHTVKTITYYDMPYYCVVGDKPADFKGATLSGDGKTCDYIWYLAKYNSKNELLALYVPEKMTDKVLKMDKTLTKADIVQMRKDFGSSFSKNYSYVLINMSVLHSDYTYAKGTLKVDATAIDIGNYVTGIEGSDGISNVAVYAVALSTINVTTPNAPEISVNKKDGKVVVSWGPVAGADKYWIYRSTDGKNYKYYDTTTKTTYTNSSVTSGVRYYYKVKAVNVVNGKEYISNYSGYRSTVPVATPTLTAKLSYGEVALSWTKVTGAVKYKIYRSTDGKNFSLYDTTTKTSYTNVSVNGGTYYYKVAAVARVDGNDWTGSDSAVKSVQTIKKPTLNIEKIDGKAKLSWDKSDTAVKYWIYRSTDGGKTYKYYDSTTKLSYTTSKCESGQKYYFKVKAVNDAGYTSQFSNAKATVLVTAPTLTAKLTDKGSAALSWNGVSGATKYYIYRSTDGENFKYYDSTAKLSYTNTSVTAGNTYYYKVKAVAVINGVDWTSAHSNTAQVIK